MIRQAALVAIALAACAPMRRTPPDADAAITVWAEAKYGDALRNRDTFFGDFTGDGAPDALVWVMYNDGGLHNFGEASLFRSRNGQLIYWRTDDDALGENPRDVEFSRGHITLTTTILQDGDARCCPTGERHWVLDAR